MEELPHVQSPPSRVGKRLRAVAPQTREGHALPRAGRFEANADAGTRRARGSGAPRGNQYAMKHGRYTARAIAARRQAAGALAGAAGAPRRAQGRRITSI